MFRIAIETCPACGGAVRIIARIEDPKVIEQILIHLDAKGAAPAASRRPPCRAPPQTRLFESDSPTEKLRERTGVRGDSGAGMTVSAT